MHILVAPNAFKNSLTATAAAEAICRGLQGSKLSCSCEGFPVGDGGDGTAALLIQRLGGITIAAEVHDPLKRKISATFGLIHQGNTAVIELADASGLRRLRRDEFAPLRATTLGTGELIRCALNQGVRSLLLAIGGSATVDGGAGILQALGVRFLDAAGTDLDNVPADLPELQTIDLSGLDERMARCEFTILCDVENRCSAKRAPVASSDPKKARQIP